MSERSCGCRQVLGWLMTHKEVPKQELSLARVFPSPERTGIHTVFEYLQW